MGFLVLALAWSLRRLKTPRATDLAVIEGILISQSYMDKLLMPVVLHLAVLEPMPVLARPRTIMPEYILQNQQTLPKQLCVH